MKKIVLSQLKPIQKIMFFLFVINIKADKQTGQVTAFIPVRWNPLTFVFALAFSLWLTVKDILINFKTVFLAAYKKTK